MNGGRSVSAPLNYLDVMPTLMEAAAAASDRPDLELDGRDALPALRGGEVAGDRDFYSYCAQLSSEREQLMAMEGDWKLIVIGPEPLDRAALAESQTMLFHLGDDPGEQNDLSAEHPEIAERLIGKALAFRALQPEEHVPIFWEGRDGFVAPERWRLVE